jgi:hypothetical protein
MPTIIKFVSGNSIVVAEETGEVRGKLNRPKAAEIEFTDTATDEPVYVNPAHVELLRNKQPSGPPRMPRSG